MKKPLLIVVSAPSGAGKSTLCDRLLAERTDIVYSVSCTTREPRGAEVDGRDYSFLSQDEFDAKIAAGEFLEYATVHSKSYGTLKDTVSKALAAGFSIMMDIDIQGADQVKACVQKAPDGDPVRDGFVDIFIAPPSIEVLRQRLEKRGEDTQEEIERRLSVAQSEMDRASSYKHVIVNDDLDRAYGELKSVVEQEEMRDEG